MPEVVEVGPCNPENEGIARGMDFSAVCGRRGILGNVPQFVMRANVDRSACDGVRLVETKFASAVGAI